MLKAISKRAHALVGEFPIADEMLGTSLCRCDTNVETILDRFLANSSSRIVRNECQDEKCLTHQTECTVYIRVPDLTDLQIHVAAQYKMSTGTCGTCGSLSIIRRSSGNHIFVKVSMTHYAFSLQYYFQIGCRIVH